MVRKCLPPSWWQVLHLPTNLLPPASRAESSLSKNAQVSGLRYLLKWSAIQDALGKADIFSLEGTFDCKMPVPPGMEFSPLTLFYSLLPKSVSHFCLGSPQFSMQQCHLSSVLARQKCLEIAQKWAVFGCIITWLGSALLFLCCPKYITESEALRMMLHFESQSKLGVKVTLQGKKQVGNIHSNHSPSLSTSVNAAVASASLGHFLPTFNANPAWSENVTTDVLNVENVQGY